MPAAVHASLSATSSETDAVPALARQTVHLQRTLQSLLDAQSDGLLAGLGRAPSASRRRPSRSPDDDDDDGPEERSPSSHTSRAHVVPVRQPPPPPRPSLQAARQGIHQGLRSLAAVKQHESSVLASQIDSRSFFLSEIDHLDAKRSGLEAQIAEITNGASDGVQGVDSLKEEEKGLQSEIQALENKLHELRARLGYVRREREERESRLGSTLSSWQNALADVQRTIRAKILDENSVLGNGIDTRKKEGVWTLPKDRRTLELVKEHVQGEKTAVDAKRKAVQREEDACLQGAQIWEHVVGKVSAVERRLKRELERLSGSVASSVSSDLRGMDGADDPDTGMEAVLDLMDETVSVLSTHLSRAEKEGWTLLVCCTGAELEALREGRDMLQAALVQSRPQIKEPAPERPKGAYNPSVEASMYTAKESPSLPSAFAARRTSATAAGGTGPEKLVDLQADEAGSEHDEGRPPADLLFSRDDGEDDGPGPDLLIEEDL